MGVFGALGIAAIVIDGDAVIGNVTAAAEEFGYFEGRLLIERELLDLAQAAQRSGLLESQEFQMTVGLRGLAVISVRAVPFTRNQTLLVLEDRTEAQRLEDTRRDFVANISHELKTPIGAIGLLAEALQDAAADPEQVQKFSKSLQRESKRLADLVQDIIELSRVQASPIMSFAQSVDLCAVINEAIDRNQILADKKRIAIVSDSEGPVLVNGNGEMLTVAIKNLIENAILYSDENSQVGIGLRTYEGFAEISVTDSGVGISVEDQARIFERFYRADPSRSRQTGGTGLGLSIVKHIANNHGGEISLFSKPGLGSTFTFRIPLKEKATE